MATEETVLEFWNQRAKLDSLAATDDFMLTKIEQKFISDVIPACSHVMDIGCGNADTLINLQINNKCTGVGIDFSKNMVDLSNERITKKGLDRDLVIKYITIPPIPNDFGIFDAVISTRTLNSLSSTEKQKEVIQSIPSILRPGGMYLMIENSLDGSELTNYMRKEIDLKSIEPPWHSIYFRNSEVETWQLDNFRIEQYLHITSLYYFLSRIVNAKYSELTGEKLKYDSIINNISLMLPQQIGEFGAVKAWIWRKSMPTPSLD